MKPAIIVLLTLSAAMSLAIEHNFPKFTLDDLSGNRVVLDSVLAHGKPVIITFWATWCKPCKKELMKLREYWESFDTTSGEHPYYIIALCEDGPRSKRQALALATKEAWDKFIIPYDDNHDIQKKAGVADIPEAFILKPDGSIYYRHIGYNPGDEKEMIEKLEELIEELNSLKNMPEQKSK